MKALVAVCLLVSMAAARAELDVPRSIFRVDKLDEAKLEATEAAKPLVFVYTDPGTS